MRVLFSWISCKNWKKKVFEKVKKSPKLPLKKLFTSLCIFRDVITGNFLVQLLRCRGRICLPGWNRVKVFRCIRGRTGCPCDYLPENMCYKFCFKSVWICWVGRQVKWLTCYWSKSTNLCLVCKVLSLFSCHHTTNNIAKTLDHSLIVHLSIKKSMIYLNPLFAFEIVFI